MTTHTGRTFLTSCLKVPIDPCNNCPAPIYNRPKMYLGRLTTTPLSTRMKLASTMSVKTSEAEAETDAMWASTGIRSLAQFYDSIPEYCDINHLPGEEFYSTLDTLRSRCRQLKTKSSNSYVQEDSSNTSSLSTPCVSGFAGKSKKTSKKKSGSAKSSSKKKPCHKARLNRLESRCMTETPYTTESKQNIMEKDRLKCFKEELNNEVEDFRKTLQEFKEEFKRPVSSTIYKPKSMILTSADNTILKSPTDRNNKERSAKDPVKGAFRENLRKSFSFNDIHCIKDHQTSTNTTARDKCLAKANNLAFKDNSKLSNYFMQQQIRTNTTTNHASNEVPKIVVESPSSEASSSKVCSSATNRSSGGRKKKSKSKKCHDQVQIPFSLFGLGSAKKESFECSASPIHPAARPNLAATLRVEVSKKRVKELENNCTFTDTTPYFDWEVRKTPAWKSLGLNESFKQALALRVATRKAEQALQRREYELNMELMRQRVKTAPLLLEGTTYWGPNVGKVTHTCQREGRKHACHSSQRRQKRGDANRDRACFDSDVAITSHMSNRIDELRKIYSSSAKSCPQTSHYQRTAKSVQHESNPIEKQPVDDSGDELSSVDRAYL